MEQSPLTQQARPDVFEPKIVGLYRQLFTVSLTEIQDARQCADGARKLKKTRSWRGSGASSSSSGQTYHD